MAAAAQLRELVERTVREIVDALDVFARVNALEARVKELEDRLSPASATAARAPRGGKAKTAQPGPTATETSPFEG